MLHDLAEWALTRLLDLRVWVLCFPIFAQQGRASSFMRQMSWSNEDLFVPFEAELPISIISMAIIARVPTLVGLSICIVDHSLICVQT